MPADGDGIDAGEIAELFVTFDKAYRARRLYHASNPMFVGFTDALRQSFGRLWSRTRSLEFTVEEHAFRWRGQSFSVGEKRSSLHFLFYKDGIRYLTFLAGFEDELSRFLDIVHQVYAEPQESEDLVTLLWRQEFQSFRYSYVDALAEGLLVPDGVAQPAVAQIDVAAIQEDVSQPDPQEASPAVEAGRPSVATSITREDFDETVYFLDAEELAILRTEFEREWQRDVKVDVLNALFDRLEERNPPRQLEILRILRQLLPAYLARGDLASASLLLVELNGVLETDALDESGRAEAEGLFRELSQPAVLGQLTRAMSDGSIDPSSEELGIFLVHLGPDALALLVQTAESTEEPALRERLGSAIQRLAGQHPEHVIRLLAATDPTVAAGAARLAGRLALTGAAAPLTALLASADVLVRRAAVEALVGIRSSQAIEGIRKALDDADREVRIAAARGLAALRYAPARAWLERVLTGKSLRAADLTEKIAFFEAFGAVANADNVAMLDRMLNGRRLWNKEPPELRSCAALALGKVGTPPAVAALKRAADDHNPMVRNAVVSALRPPQTSAS